MSDILPLLSRLKALNIDIRLKDGQLKINAPKDTLTPGLLEELKKKKQAIIEFLKHVQQQKNHVPVEPSEKKEYYPPAPAQKRLFILQQMEPQNTGYNMPNVLILEEDIDKEELEGIFKILIARHETLRTSFEMIDEEPVQKVHDSVTFHIEYYDLAGAPGSPASGIIRGFVRPFDLSRAPLLRVGLITCEEKKNILMLDVHHIVTDGISQNLLTGEFLRLFTGRRLPDLKLQYKDYVRWLNHPGIRETLSQQEAYWLEEFEGEIPVLNLPYDFPRPAVWSFEGYTLEFEIGDLETQALKEIASRQRITFFLLMLSIFHVLLSKLTSQEDIVVGIDSAGRNQPGLEPIIGMFVNTLPLRNFPAPQKSFDTFLAEVRERFGLAFNNQGYPFEDLVDRIALQRDFSRNPLFDVMFAFDDTAGDTTPAGGLKAKPYPYENTTAKFDMTWVATEAAGQLFFSLEYCTKLFRKDTVQRFIAYFKQAVSFVIRNSHELHRPIADIDILPEEQKKQILFDFNANSAPFPKDRTICSIVSDHAARAPHRVAFAGDGNHLTYGELDKRAGHPARLLRRRGVGRDRLVGVLCKRSVEMAVGILAAWRAGGAYIPIDVNYPFPRIADILADSRAEVILTMPGAFADTTGFYTEIVRRTEVRHILYLDTDNEKEADSRQEHRLFRTLRYAALLEQGAECVKPRTVAKVGMEPLFRYGAQTLTQKECISNINRIARFVSDRGILIGSPVAVLFSNPIHKIVALRYLETCNGANPVPFIVLTPEMGRSEMKRVIETAAVATVFSESRFLDLLDSLLWESAIFNRYFILNRYDVESTDREAHFKDIWDYVAEESSEAANDYGWTGSYTNQPFTIEEMNQYTMNFKVKLEPYLTPRSRVLDIGCGHGLVLFEVAPRAGYYLATDLSPVIIEKNKRRLQREGLKNTALKAAPASGIHKLGENNFDIILCSSVVHYFPNTLYLEDVIRKAVDLLKDKGIIYLDDLMNLGKKEELIRSTSAYKESNPGAQVKTDWDGDLFVSPDFFRHLQRKIPEIVEWQSSYKLGKIKNELTRFRYDVLLKIDKNKDKNKEFERHRYTLQEMEIPAGAAVPSLPGAHIDTRAFDPLPNMSGDSEPLPFSDLSRLSYVIYTSGSTGKPKGAMVEHIGMMNHMQAKIGDLQLNAESVVVQNASHTFDISVWQFFAALVPGGKTIVYPDELVLEPGRFITRLIRDRVTILEVVPSYLSVMLDFIGESAVVPLPLRYLLVTGEEIKTNLVKKWFEIYPHIKMINAYGPTEASDDITHHIMAAAPGTGRIPIGRSLQNLDIYIVDRRMKLCPIGVPGEICVSGVGVGRGYLNDSEKTMAVFSRDPFARESDVRMYKTGDLGRWMPDGVVEFIGRKDHQVKIRGFRIELGEIEIQLVHHPQVREALVVAPEEGRERYLCAYVVTHGELEVPAVREHLARHLPEYMIPAYIIKLEKLPLTANGKVDRKALPAPEAIDSHRYIPPSTPLEEKLTAIWADILGIDSGTIGMGANFFELGGHSLNATVMASRVHKALNVKISIADIFQIPTLAGLSQFIRQAVEDKYAAIEPMEEREQYPLSSGQKRMYILSRVDENSTRYNISMVMRLEGELDKDRVDEVFKKLVQRHESFRTSFEMMDNEPLQRIHDAEALDFSIRYYDLGGSVTESGVEKVAGEYVRSFDLSRPPLLRVALVKETGEKYILVVDMHHIISDGTSLDILEQEFMALYAGETFPPLKLRYRDYAGWQHRLVESGIMKRQQEYWLNRFEGSIPVLNIPLDYPRPADPSGFKAEGNRIPSDIDAVLTTRIRRLAGETGTTLYIVLLAVYNILLSKYSTQEDIIVGSPIAGRRHPDLENIVGLFVNMLAMRNRPGGDKSFGEFLEEVKINALDAYDNQDYQFEDLVWNLDLKFTDEAGRSPLFDAVFVLENTVANEIEIREKNREALSKIEAEPYELGRKVHYQLLLFASELGDTLFISLEYAVELFKESTAGEMMRDYMEILTRVLENPDIKLRDISVSHDLIAAKAPVIPEEQGDFRL